MLYVCSCLGFFFINGAFLCYTYFPHITLFGHIKLLIQWATLEALILNEIFMFISISTYVVTSNFIKQYNMKTLDHKRCKNVLLSIIGLFLATKKKSLDYISAGQSNISQVPNRSRIFLQLNLALEIAKEHVICQ